MAGLISQAGMALVVKLGGTYRPVTLKSTAMMIAVAYFAMMIVASLYALFGKKGTLCYVLSALLFIIVIQSFLCPVNGVYYRYPSIAAILAVELLLTPLILGKYERYFGKIISKGFTEENIFAVAALVSGMIIAILLPVSSYNSWDDENHYERVLYMSQSIYASETDADIDLIYSPFIEARSEEAKEYSDKLDAEEKNTEKVIAYNSARAFFPDRIGYLGSLFATWAGRALNLPFSVRYILGRVGNLVSYVGIMYFAIKHLRHGKTLLLVLSLAPTAVFLASNYSADPWVLSLSALSFSYFFRAIEEEKKLTYREIFIMVGAMALAVLPKLPYLCLLAFLLLMPREKFESRRQMRNYRILVIAVACAIFALLYISSFGQGDIGDVRGQEGVVSGVGQVKYIFSNPKAFISMLIESTVQYLNPIKMNGAFIAFGCIGKGAGYILIAIAIVISALTDSPKSKVTIRIFGIIICIAMCAVLETVFYIVCTPVGDGQIVGCQIRYIVPMLLPMTALLLGGYVSLDGIVQKVTKWVPVLISLAVLTLNIFILFKR